MSTLGELKTRIADEMDDPNISTEIANAITSAIKFYERQKFYFNEKYINFNTVANQNWYTSSDLADIGSLLSTSNGMVTVGNAKSPLLIVDPAQMDSADTGVQYAPPRMLAYYRQQFRMFPIPNDVYRIDLMLNYRLASLTDDSQSNAWTDDAEELIRQRAKHILKIDVTKELSQDAPPGILEMQALDALKMESRQRRSNDALRTDLSTMRSDRRFSIWAGTYV